MSQFVTIQSVTANTPVDIYYCNSGGGDCQFVASVATFPFSFYVPSPYSESTIIIKIEDTQGCIDELPIDITPTPTPNVTKTPTMTPTPSYSPTLSPTQTPSMTPTNSPTTSNTATISSTPTATPVVVFHPTADSCLSPLNVTGYYTYISEANLVPVVGATIYQTLLNGVLYNPLNGGGNTYIISFGGTLYQVVIDSQGKIVSFSLCVPSTPTQTQTQTPTPSITPFAQYTMTGSCNSEVQALGGRGIYTYTIDVGSSLGDSILSFDAFNIPDQFQVFWNNTTVIDTGFRGDPIYNPNLNALGYSDVSGPGSGTTSFTKSLASPSIITVVITAPLQDTAFKFLLSCPIVPSQTPSQTPTQTPTPSVTPPLCYPTLADSCPLFITNSNGNSYYYNLSANTSNVLYPWPVYSPFTKQNLAITDTKMYVLDSQGVVYDYNYTITPTTGCLLLSYVQTIDLFPYYISSASCIAVKDNNTLFVGTTDTTGTTIYNFNLTTSGTTTYMEVGNNAYVAGMIYNTGNTQMVLSYFQPLSGFSGQVQLYSGTTLLSSIPTSDATSNAQGLYWDGTNVVGINRDTGRRWIYNFSANTSTELLPAIPLYGLNQIGGTGMIASCQNFNVPY